jgi:hypothetical protein
MVRRLKDLANYYSGDPKVRWARAALQAARGRANKQGVEFDITLKDIQAVIVDICPALGMPLDYSRGRVVMQDDSPTLDKLIPCLGYTKGNIAVVSAKANSAKGRCSPDELSAVVRWQIDALTAHPKYGVVV